MRTHNFCIAGNGVVGSAHAEALIYKQHRIETLSAKCSLNKAGAKIRVEKVPGSISGDVRSINEQAFEWGKPGSDPNDEEGEISTARYAKPGV
ncbi:hypothetical protein [Paraburkholderia sp. GAS42]|uniref:hypothetical protein n=1 Tax=Paraburkholderia sp. GAS42 TaxID=3035135 RepID=UPI003D2082F7